MSRREINLIGGFYKDSSLPWSSQDTVNWLPVPAQSEGTRSPMKLRGVPGLKSLDETVVIQRRIVVVPVTATDPPGGVVNVPLPAGFGVNDIVIISRVQGASTAAAGTITGLPVIGPGFAEGSNASTGVFCTYGGFRITAGMAPNIVWTPSTATPQTVCGVFVFIPSDFWSGALVGVANRIATGTTTTPSADFSSWGSDKAVLCRFVFGPAGDSVGVTSLPSPKDWSGSITTGTGANQSSISYTVALVSAQNAGALLFPASTPANGIAATFPLRVNASASL